MLKLTKIMSLIILLLGLALVGRTLVRAGGVTMSAGMIAGLAFTAYGAVRLYYLKGSS